MSMKRLGATVLAVGSLAGLGAQTASAATTTEYATTLTNIRAGASTSTAIVAKINAGTAITGTLASNGWIKITSPSNLAGRYVSSTVLTTKAPVKAPAGTVTGWVASSDHSVNVRSGPGLNYKVVKTLAKFSQVTGVVSGDWIKVAGGYINKGLIETTSSNIFAVNGYVPQSSMCAIPLAYNATTPVSPNYTAATTRYLNCEAVKGLNSLEAAYKAKFGHYALIDLAYRSHAEEVYWKTVRPIAAAPVGTSNHGWGLAVDFHEADDAKGNELKSGEFYWGKSGYNWLVANASKYGFAGDPVKYGTADESYHWNFVG